MKWISRILVSLLMAILAQSSLGTNYAKADLSNAITKSFGQNGYAKFKNNLVIQWGYASDNQYNFKQTIYLPHHLLMEHLMQ